jgi:hypothetical protein
VLEQSFNSYAHWRESSFIRPSAKSGFKRQKNSSASKIIPNLNPQIKVEAKGQLMRENFWAKDPFKKRKIIDDSS